MRSTTMCMVLCALATAASAHHSGAMFDQAKTITLVGTVKEYQFQVGANADQTIKTQIQSFSAISLGIDDIDLVQLPTFAIAHLDEALDFVNRQRANIGAVLNRLDATATNLQINAENTSAARSRIMDADFAQESAVLTRQQILTQAATAMLSQANSQPNMALSLLRG